MTLVERLGALCATNLHPIQNRAPQQKYLLLVYPRVPPAVPTLLSCIYIRTNGMILT